MGMDPLLYLHFNIEVCAENAYGWTYSVMQHLHGVARRTCEQRMSPKYAWRNGTPNTEVPRFVPGVWMLLAYDTGRQPVASHWDIAMPVLQLCQDILLDSWV